MKIHSIFLMGIIFLIVDAQAMHTNKEKTPFLIRLAKEQAAWESRQKKNSNNSQGITDTFELETLKKLEKK